MLPKGSMVDGNKMMDFVIPFLPLDDAALRRVTEIKLQAMPLLPGTARARVCFVGSLALFTCGYL